MVQLSNGALAIVLEGGDYPTPIVQILKIKKVNSESNQSEQDKYQVRLFDGKTSGSHAILSGQVYAKAGEKGLPKRSIIKIIEYDNNALNDTKGRDKPSIQILDFQVLKYGDEEDSNKATTTDPAQLSTSSDSDGNESEPAQKKPKLLDSSNVINDNGGRNMPTAKCFITPIATLTPYYNSSTIMARVMYKSEVKNWSNARGHGKLFRFDLFDESGEIRCTAFQNMVDKYFNMITVDKVYYISECYLKNANKQYNTLKNKYEMIVSEGTEIEECQDDDGLSSLQIKYDFIDIAKISDMEPNEVVDVIGVVKSTSDLQTVRSSKNEGEFKKKEVQLIDQSNTSISVTLWGSDAESFIGSGNPIIALKGAKIKEFNGEKYLSSFMMKINPQMEECSRLKKWYESEGKHVDARNISHTKWMSFNEVLNQQMGSIKEDKPIYWQVQAKILSLGPDSGVYKACPTPRCNKKIIDNHDGTYKCEKCPSKDLKNFNYKLLLHLNLADSDGNNLWVSMFNDEAEKVLGMAAQEIAELQGRDPELYEKTMENVQLKEFIFKCITKMETYKEDRRLKTVVRQVDPINHFIQYVANKQVYIERLYL